MFREKFAIDFYHSIEQAWPNLLTPPAQPLSSEEVPAPCCVEDTGEILGEVDWSDSCCLRNSSRAWSPGLLIPSPNLYLSARKQINI